MSLRSVALSRESHQFCLLSLEVGSLRPEEVLPGNSFFLFDHLYAVQHDLKWQHFPNCTQFGIPNWIQFGKICPISTYQFRTRSSLEFRTGVSLEFVFFHMIEYIAKKNIEYFHSFIALDILQRKDGYYSYMNTIHRIGSTFTFIDHHISFSFQFDLRF